MRTVLQTTSTNFSRRFTKKEDKRSLKTYRLIAPSPRRIVSRCSTPAASLCLVHPGESTVGLPTSTFRPTRVFLRLSDRLTRPRDETTPSLVRQALHFAPTLRMKPPARERSPPPLLLALPALPPRVELTRVIPPPHLSLVLRGLDGRDCPGERTRSLTASPGCFPGGPGPLDSSQFRPLWSPCVLWLLVIFPPFNDWLFTWLC